MTVHLFTDQEVEDILDNTIVNKRSDKAEIMFFALTLRDAIEKKNFEESVEGVWVDALLWQEETFPEATVQSIANHILSEVRELVESPLDREEVADILLLIGHWLYKTRTNIWPVMSMKLHKNKSRQWGKVNERGFVEHIREEKPKHLGRVYMKIDKDGNPYGIGHTGGDPYIHEGPGHVEHWNGEGDPPF